MEFISRIPYDGLPMHLTYDILALGPYMLEFLHKNLTCIKILSFNFCEKTLREFFCRILLVEFHLFGIIVSSFCIAPAHNGPIPSKAKISLSSFMLTSFHIALAHSGPIPLKAKISLSNTVLIGFYIALARSGPIPTKAKISLFSVMLNSFHIAPTHSGPIPSKAKISLSDIVLIDFCIALAHISLALALLQLSKVKSPQK